MVKEFKPQDKDVHVGDPKLKKNQLWADLVCSDKKTKQALAKTLAHCETFKEALQVETFRDAAGWRITEEGGFIYIGDTAPSDKIDSLERSVNHLFYDLDIQERIGMHRIWVKYVNLARVMYSDEDDRIECLEDFNHPNWLGRYKALCDQNQKWIDEAKEEEEEEQRKEEERRLAEEAAERAKETAQAMADAGKGSDDGMHQVSFISAKENTSEVSLVADLTKANFTDRITALLSKQISLLPEAGEAFEDLMKSERDISVVRNFADSIAKGSTLKHMADIISSFEYEGFDPFTTYWQLKAYAGKTDKKDFQIEMMLCSVLFLMRGTSIVSAKKLEKMSGEGKNIVQKLKTKYCIEPKLGDRSTKRTITLSRIVATVPQATVAFLKQLGDSVSRPVSLPGIRKEFPEFPSCMRTSCFFALIPKRRSSVPYIMAMLHHQFLESFMINKPLAKKGASAVMESVLVYSRSAFDSKVTENHEQRERLFAIYAGDISKTTLEIWRAAFEKTYPKVDVEGEFGL